MNQDSAAVRSARLLSQVALAYTDVRVECAEARLLNGGAAVVEMFDRTEPPIWLGQQRFDEMNRFGKAVNASMSAMEVAGTGLGSWDGRGPFGMFDGNLRDLARRLDRELPKAEEALARYLEVARSPTSTSSFPITIEVPLPGRDDDPLRRDCSLGRELGVVGMASFDVAKGVSVVEQVAQARAAAPPYELTIERYAGVQVSYDVEPALLAGVCALGLERLTDEVDAGRRGLPSREVMTVLESEFEMHREAARTRLDEQGPWPLLDQHAMHDNVARRLGRSTTGAQTGLVGGP